MEGALLVDCLPVRLCLCLGISGKVSIVTEAYKLNYVASSVCVWALSSLNLARIDEFACMASNAIETVT